MVKRSPVRRFFGYPLVTILLGFVVFAALFSLLFSVLYQLVVVAVGASLSDDLRPESPRSAFALGLGQFLAGVILAALALWVYRRFFLGFCEGRRDVPELALTATARRWLLGGTLLALLVVAVSVIAGGPLTWAPSLSVAGGLLGALGMATFAGVVEELFARGLLFRISQDRLGSLIALAITGTVFGLQHADNPGATALTTAAVALGGGLMLASVYMVSGTLWAPIAVHFGWNFGQSVLGLPVSGNEQTGAAVAQLRSSEELTGGAFGIEASWVSLLAWGAVFVMCVILAIRTGKWRSWSTARGAPTEAVTPTS